MSHPVKDSGPWPSINDLRAEINRLRAENKQLQQQNYNQREMLAEITSELYWLQCLIANPEVQGNQTRVLYAVHQLTNHSKPRQDGMIRMYRQDIVKYSGLSPATVSRTIKKLADSGNLLRDVKTSGGGQQDIEKELYVRIPDSILKDPMGITAHSDDDKWGGYRVRTCRSCGSTNLQELHKFICRDCGQDHQADETINLLESTLYTQAQMEQYPLAQTEAMATQDVRPPHRECIRCGERLWLPAFKENTWIYLCGGPACHPRLLESKGTDLTTGTAYE